jgi:hypothetical protein
MKNTTDFTFKLLNVLSWIIFIGLAIDTGSYITNTIYTLFLIQMLLQNFGEI